MLGDDVVPDPQGALEVACDPGIQGLHMGPFPRGRPRRHGARSSSRFGGKLHVRQLVGGHREVAGETMRETEPRIGGERAGKMLWGIGAVFQIRQDGAVEAGGCFHG